MESQLKVSENVDGKMRSRKPIRSKRKRKRTRITEHQKMAYLAQFLVKYARNLLPNTFKRNENRTQINFIFDPGTIY